ncbi:MAG: metalloregulator ArsR/SmtB family transcription factor [Pseudomonadota bacterium]
MNDESAAALLGALANPTRLGILRHLVKAGADGAPAGEIAGVVNSSPSRASFHLAAMTDLHVLTAERNARQIIYRIDFDVLGGLLNFIIEDCCAGNPTMRACCETTSTTCA